MHYTIGQKLRNCGICQIPEGDKDRWLVPISTSFEDAVAFSIGSEKKDDICRFLLVIGLCEVR